MPRDEKIYTMWMAASGPEDNTRWLTMENGMFSLTHVKERGIQGHRKRDIEMLVTESPDNWDLRICEQPVD